MDSKVGILCLNRRVADALSTGPTLLVNQIINLVASTYDAWRAYRKNLPEECRLLIQRIYYTLRDDEFHTAGTVSLLEEVPSAFAEGPVNLRRVLVARSAGLYPLTPMRGLRVIGRSSPVVSAVWERDDVTVLGMENLGLVAAQSGMVSTLVGESVPLMDVIAMEQVCILCDLIARREDWDEHQMLRRLNVHKIRDMLDLILQWDLVVGDEKDF